MNMYNRAKFQQNGGCGYVLKPSFMGDPEVYSVEATKGLSKLPGRKVSST